MAAVASAADRGSRHCCLSPNLHAAVMFATQCFFIVLDMEKQASHTLRILDKIHAGDVLAFTWCLQLHQLDQQRTLTRASRIISASADGFYYPLIPLLLYAAGDAGALDLLLILSLGFLIERPVYYVAKNAFKRNRPAQALPGFSSAITPSDHFSFPSGHTSGAFLMATAVVMVYPALFWPMYLWACLVGTSRILLGVHFPTDTLAGAVMGVGWACLAGTLAA